MMVLGPGRMARVWARVWLPLAALLALMLAGQAAWAVDAPLRIIASPIPHAEILQFVQRKLAPDLKLKIIEASGDLRLNELLARGDVDANFFQHRPFLESEEKMLGVTLAPVTAVHIEPLGVYSTKVTSLRDLPQGAKVSIPNNVVNLSRALYLLQENGLITLRQGADARDSQLATARDITANPQGLKIIEVDAAQLPRTLPDVTLAVINGNYALEAGLQPAKDALALEKAAGNPYANLLVTTPALEHDPRIQRLARLLDGPEVAAFIRERYKGAVIPVHP
ncbi:MetQ/NlpA family ABC transporter substrate-binding protein [Nitrospirillum sp. BR 11163]|uniref:MetQ/NlpA family ABC transporter substrate-binding protein n=1 Tax=Nitrospirillum sp. BR 11163 TaxID=3104323 RepID=UPI002AFED1BB|nr:MetQ/NlpA family ABC transporter substrate-binding protein [Nitrospirillum sp. BR 11163]MEA1674659.1 MetQ/NlpA family ABC transporter substrate-binding protein [Nitrospirillum sp. BR 11163]